MYRDERFEWDEGKDRANQALHGLGFRDICGAFDDPHGLETADHRFNEDRWVLIALIPHTELVVTIVYTERGERDRIISARTSTSSELRTYFEHRF